MNGVVEGFRWAMLGTGRAPDGIFALSSLMIVLLFFVSFIVFLRSEHSIVDVV
jgi:lipopolysaccharide transport system permease protein